jgi:hypothetical protein
MAAALSRTRELAALRTTTPQSHAEAAGRAKEELMGVPRSWPTLTTHLTTTGSDTARSQRMPSWPQPQVSDRIRQLEPILQAGVTAA